VAASAAALVLARVLNAGPGSAATCDWVSSPGDGPRRDPGKPSFRLRASARLRAASCLFRYLFSLLLAFRSSVILCLL